MESQACSSITVHAPNDAEDDSEVESDGEVGSNAEIKSNQAKEDPEPEQSIVNGNRNIFEQINNFLGL